MAGDYTINKQYINQHWTTCFQRRTGGGSKKKLRRDSGEDKNVAMGGWVGCLGEAPRWATAAREGLAAPCSEDVAVAPKQNEWKLWN